MVAPMAKRLTAQAWIDFALATLAREGFEALKAEVLARKLGVSRGSFYWHFEDIETFHARVIQQWRQVATEAIIADVELQEAPEQRLDVLLRHAFGDGAALEVGMRAWGDMRTTVLYWAYLGAAVSHYRLSGRNLDQIVAQLMCFARAWLA